MATNWVVNFGNPISLGGIGLEINSVSTRRHDHRRVLSGFCVFEIIILKYESQGILMFFEILTGIATGVLDML